MPLPQLTSVIIHIVTVPLLLVAMAMFRLK